MRTTIVALAAALAAAGLGLAVTAAERPEVGDAAPGFTLPATDGSERELAELEGERAAVLVFFRGLW